MKEGGGDNEPARKSYDLEEIHRQKLQVLTGVCSREDWLIETSRKLVDYRAVLHIDHLNIGSYVRYIKLAGGDNDASEKLMVGGILVGVFESANRGYGEDGEDVGGGGSSGGDKYHVQLKSVGMPNRVWNASFGDCVFFQKFARSKTDQIVFDSLKFIHSM